MSKYIKLFESAADLEAAKSSMPRPCVAWSPDSNEPYYKPYIPGVIEFKDVSIKNLLVNSQDPLIDTNGDGEIEMSEAAAVTNFKTLFKNNTSIVEFNECQYFMNVRSYETTFYGCSNLEEVTIDNSVSDIAISCSQMFENCAKLKTLTIGNLKAASLANFLASCTDIEYVDLSNIDVSSCRSISSIANGCTKLTTIDMSGWELSQNITGNTMLTRSGVRTIIMSGCSDASITKMKSLIQAFATAVGFTIVDNTGTGSTNGAGTYTCAINTSEWVFTPAN